MKKEIKIGNVKIGGNNKIAIQSMTNTKTSNIDETIKQIKELENVGCDIIRVAILDLDDAKSLKTIKKEISIPLVADIHFDYKLAIEAIQNGADKIRINPGNMKQEHLHLLVNVCKEYNIPIRIGVNSGSMPNNLEPTPENMVNETFKIITLLENLDFFNIVLSLKATDTKTMIKANELISNKTPYPLHLGVTEAGTLLSGSIKSAIGIGTLLYKGIGDTIRVSLTDDPINEIKVAKEILKDLNLRNNVPNLISCPTCGRIQYDMIPIAKKIEQFLNTIDKEITVALMGCIVNGPGEASHANIGIAGGKNEATLFKDGKIIRKLKLDEIYETLVEEILKY